ncbi:uncharacterized protein [Anabrus simplex]|uniref:uncharacterized protein isoform X2 n=1 Tax=Anabrus simplex TaxID=316456 RepID=UPI0035A2C6AA
METKQLLVLGCLIAICLALLPRTAAGDEEAMPKLSGALLRSRGSVSEEDETDSEEKKGSSAGAVTSPINRHDTASEENDSAESEEKPKEHTSTAAPKARRTTSSEENDTSESEEKDKKSAEVTATTSTGDKEQTKLNIRHEEADDSGDAGDDDDEDDDSSSKERTYAGK